MSDGKHSSNGKHSKKFNKQERSGKGKKTIKLILLFILLVILAIVIYALIFLKEKEPYEENNISNTTEIIYENSTAYELSENGETKESIYVEGAEYLEIIKFNVIADENISTVSTKFKNNSNKSYENIELRITLLDDNNVEITSLDYIINKIEANGEVLAHGSVKKDLSNCTTCSVALRKK